MKAPRQLRQEHIGISTLKDSTSSHITTDPAEKANTLNEHFMQVKAIPNKGGAFQSCKRSFHSISESLYPSLPDFEITS